AYTAGREDVNTPPLALHPRAAAVPLHNRAAARGVVRSVAALFVEISSSTAAAARVMPEPEMTREPTEVVIADTIRTRVDSLWRKRPRLGEAIGAAAAPATKAVGKTVAVGFELMPRRAPPLPRHVDNARDRSRRQRRAASLLAVGLLAVAGVI